MADNFEKATIQWRPGFYSAAELELHSDKEVLAFQREYNLSKEPLRMDLPRERRCKKEVQRMR